VSKVDYTFTAKRVAQLYTEKWAKESPEAANAWLNINYPKEDQQEIIPYLKKCFARYNINYNPPKE
jgi:hypothetical protein